MQWDERFYDNDDSGCDSFIEDIGIVQIGAGKEERDEKQHFQTIFKTGTAILLCGIALTGCGTKNQQNATANITTVGNTALEQPMRLEALKDDETDYQAYWGTKIQCITRGEHGYYYLTPEEPLYLMYWTMTRRRA